MQRPSPPADLHDEALRRRLVAFARRFVGDRGEAEDLAQETLLRAGAGLAGLRARERAEAWLFRICRHAAIDHVRARRVRRVVWGALPEDAASWAEAPAPEPRPAAPALDLARVAAHHRVLLALHYEQGLSQASLCRRTGLSAAALRVRLYRARKALARALGRRQEQDDEGR